MSWSVELYDRSDMPVMTEGLTLAPTFYSARAWGGPDVAEVAVRGDANALWACINWLRFRVVIRNPLGNRVWWGYVNGVAVGMGAVEVGRTLDGMSNRIVADYTHSSPTGGEERGTTGWAQDTGSVGMYGAKEERLSVADATQAQAEAARDTALAKRGSPVATLSMNESTGARLDCVGLWRTLAWQLYSNTAGREEHAVEADIEHMLGWAKAASQARLAMSGNRIDDLDCQLAHLIPGSQIRISGAYLGDGLYTVEKPGDPEDTYHHYVSDGMGFEHSDDVWDELSGLGFLKVGYMVYLQGSAQSENRGTFWVAKIQGPGAFEVESHGIVDENDVGPISLDMGQQATVVSPAFLSQTITPNQTVTLTGVGSVLSQEFELPTVTGWTVREVRFRARKVGSPADNLRVRIMSFGGGATLATGTLAGSAVLDEMVWLTFDLGAGVTVAGSGTKYLLVVDRTGAADWDDFYVVGLESAKTYARGQLLVYDSITATWATRQPDDAQLPFLLAGRTDTTRQIGEMLHAAQFVGAVDVQAISGVEVNPWREGDQTVLTEVERLLETGTASGGALEVRVLPDRTLQVVAQAVSSQADLLIAQDGRLVEPIRGPAEEGLLPVGQWVTIDGAPSQLEDVATFYVDRAEFDVTGGRLRLEPRVLE